jgi:hypothetical protein
VPLFLFTFLATFDLRNRKLQSIRFKLLSAFMLQGVNWPSMHFRIVKKYRTGGPIAYGYNLNQYTIVCLQAIVHSLSHLEGMSRSEAEYAFVVGVIRTAEEMRKCKKEMRQIPTTKTPAAAATTTTTTVTTKPTAAETGTKKLLL